MAFIGILSTLLIAPPLADKYGRKIVFLVANIISAIGQFGLIVSNNIYELYFFAFLVGASFAGKIVVGLNYMLEYNIPKWHETIIYLLMVAESTFMILITVWFQFIDRGVILIQVICLVLAILITIYFAAAVPESPKWLYTFFRFDESREKLKYVAGFNSIPDKKRDRISRLKFDLEELQK
jgi:MFS family permease